ncbi:hypothetical protein ACQ4PT_039431 [Festuca glaucescens]
MASRYPSLDDPIIASPLATRDLPSEAEIEKTLDAYSEEGAQSNQEEGNKADEVEVEDEIDEDLEANEDEENTAPAKKRKPIKGRSIPCQLPSLTLLCSPFSTDLPVGQQGNPEYVEVMSSKRKTVRGPSTSPAKRGRGRGGSSRVTTDMDKKRRAQLKAVANVDVTQNLPKFRDLPSEAEIEKTLDAYSEEGAQSNQEEGNKADEVEVEDEIDEDLEANEDEENTAPAKKRKPIKGRSIPCQLPSLTLLCSTLSTDLPVGQQGNPEYVELMSSKRKTVRGPSASPAKRGRGRGGSSRVTTDMDKKRRAQLKAVANVDVTQNLPKFRDLPSKVEIEKTLDAYSEEGAQSNQEEGNKADEVEVEDEIDDDLEANEDEENTAPAKKRKLIKGRSIPCQLPSLTLLCSPLSTDLPVGQQGNPEYVEAMSSKRKIVRGPSSSPAKRGRGRGGSSRVTTDMDKKRRAQLKAVANVDVTQNLPKFRDLPSEVEIEKTLDAYSEEGAQSNQEEGNKADEVEVEDEIDEDLEANEDEEKTAPAKKRKPIKGRDLPSEVEIEKTLDAYSEEGAQSNQEEGNKADEVEVEDEIDEDLEANEDEENTAPAKKRKPIKGRSIPCQLPSLTLLCSPLSTDLPVGQQGNPEYVEVMSSKRKTVRGPSASPAKRGRGRGGSSRVTTDMDKKRRAQLKAVANVDVTQNLPKFRFVILENRSSACLFLFRLDFFNTFIQI